MNNKPTETVWNNLKVVLFNITTTDAKTDPTTISINKLSSLYLPRGCWNDNNNNKSISNTPIILTNVAGRDSSKWLEYAMRRAYKENYDTFAFQEGNKLLLGNYNTVGNDISDLYKYDKYGEAYGVNCSDFGEKLINRVYSNESLNKYSIPYSIRNKI